MADTLIIGGKTYNNVTGIKATDNNEIIQIYSKGDGSAEEKTVKFRDYDGTVVYSYTASEFAALTALPANPDHSNDEVPLTSQGWNWSLTAAKTYVASYGRLEIGQMYVTADGKTYIHIHLEEGRTSPMLGCCPNGTVDVDWGDGTTHDTLTGTSVTTSQRTSAHNYAAPGDYVIKLTVTGSMGLSGSSSTNQYCGLLRYAGGADTRNQYYIATIRKVEIGSNVTSIYSNAFYNCSSLTSLTIPSNVTSIGGGAFYGCYSLTSLTIPSNITSIGTYAFQNCYSLTSLTIPSGIASIGSSAFQNCYSLTSLTIPNDVTSISSNTFYNCYSLTSLTIPNGVTSIGSGTFTYCYGLTSLTIPSGVTSISNSTFYGCSSLTSLTIPSGVTSIGNYAFNGCYTLTSLTIPSGVTSIGTYAFQSCYCLTSLTIPSDVTSIGGTTFNMCYSLTSLTIPSDVTSIGTYAFQGCYGLTALHFKPTTPPTVANSNAFNNLPTDCIIYVPTGSLTDYTTATNYPDSNTYTYVEE